MFNLKDPCKDCDHNNPRQCLRPQGKGRCPIGQEYSVIHYQAKCQTLREVVDDLKEQRDWLAKQTPYPNTQLGQRFKTTTLRIYNKLIREYEQQLQEAGIEKQ